MRAAKVEQVKGATWPEHAPYLVQGSLLLVTEEMVEHQGREHSVVGLVGIGKLVRETSIQLHGRALPVGLPPGAVQCLGIRIEPDDVDPGMERLDQYRQVPGSTADLENALTRVKMRLVDELPMRPGTSDQLHEGVVKRKQPVASGRRDEASLIR